MKSYKRLSVLMAAAAFVSVAACGSAADSEFGSSSGNTSGEGSSGGQFGDGSSGGASSGEPLECAAHEAAANLTKRPVDIIFVIDNSGSMSGEIAEVEKQINDNFAKIIEAANIDYRVIMLASHGANKDQKICVKAPLSGTSCSPIPDEPVETAKFFHHSQKISSTDAWCRILDSFNRRDEFTKHADGFKTVLRDGAFKVITVISDDRSECSFDGKTYKDNNSAAGGQTAAEAFDADLMALSPKHFGTSQNRNYVWHSIVSLAPFDAQNLALAHPPSAPVTTEMCSPGAQKPGTGHQALSKLTGGLRYPTCGLNYTTIFQEMAKGVIDGAKVACEFPVPEPPAGESLDLTTVVTTYTPQGTGTPVDFEQVAGPGACGANKFYIEGELIKLCPATCAAVQKDSSAKLRVRFGCAVAGTN
jgi:hypothetical protein